MANLGNELNQILCEARAIVFAQGEHAALTYAAFSFAAVHIRESEQEEFEFSIPIGHRPDRTAINSQIKYTKVDLLDRYGHLADYQLSINLVLQLVTVVEAMLNDIVRAAVLNQPEKIGAKRSVPLKTVLEAKSLEEIHMSAADSLVNDLSYKSPADYAVSIGKILPINLLECPSFHKYIEIKATRDAFVHNRGIAGEPYIRKADTHRRVESGSNLPMDNQYFLESLESCLKLLEWLEIKLHRKWPSSEFEKRQQEFTTSNDGAE
jgi:hypothetical protein